MAINYNLNVKMSHLFLYTEKWIDLNMKASISSIRWMTDNLYLYLDERYFDFCFRSWQNSYKFRKTSLLGFYVSRLIMSSSHGAGWSLNNTISWWSQMHLCIEINEIFWQGKVNKNYWMEFPFRWFCCPPCFFGPFWSEDEKYLKSLKSALSEENIL